MKRFICMLVIICSITTLLGSSVLAFSEADGRIQSASAERMAEVTSTLSTPEESVCESSPSPSSFEEPFYEPSPLPSSFEEPPCEPSPSSLPETPDANPKGPAIPDAVPAENSNIAVPSVSGEIITFWEWVGNRNDVPYWFHDRWELALSLTPEEAANEDYYRNLLPAKINATLADGRQVTLPVTWEFNEVWEKICEDLENLQAETAMISGDGQGVAAFAREEAGVMTDNTAIGTSDDATQLPGYAISGSLPAEYMLGLGTRPLIVTLLLDSPSTQAYVTLNERTGNVAPSVIRATDPDNTTINLFDYTVVPMDPATGDQMPAITDYLTWMTKGVNNGHLLMFGNNGFNYGYWNRGAGSGSKYGQENGIFNGIVANKLLDGYPVINTADINGGYSQYNDKLTQVPHTGTGINPADYPQYQKNISDIVQKEWEAGGANPSLDYLFDPNASGTDSYREAYTDVKGLFQLDDHGYYTYNMRNNAAVYDSTSNRFILYESPAVSRTDITKIAGSTVTDGVVGGTPLPVQYGIGNFFPFNPAEPEVGYIGGTDTPAQFAQWNNIVSVNDTGNWPDYISYNNIPGGGTVTNVKAGSGSTVSPSPGVTERRVMMNHYFGMTFESIFRQPDNGKVVTGSAGEEPMVFEFAGDDDVWIFIDDVLVMDLGGIHSELFGKIDYSTGTVTTGKAYDSGGIPSDEYLAEHPDAVVKTTSLREMFRNAGMEGAATWNNNTFASNTNHTIKMFYLERGNYDASCAIRFNLQPLLYQQIKKVDQNGNPIAGVTFELYPAMEATQDEEGAILCNNTSEGRKYIKQTDDHALTSITTDIDGIGKIQKNPETDTAVPFPFPDSYDETTGEGRFYILKEVNAPAGYRRQPLDIVLEFQPSITMLRVANRWSTGSYASWISNITGYESITYGRYDPATDKVVEDPTKVVPESTQQYGLAVAIPMFLSEKTGRWDPMYGNNMKGFASVAPADLSIEARRQAGLTAALLQAALADSNRKDPYYTAKWHLNWDNDKRRLTGTIQDLPGAPYRYVLKNPDGDMRMEYAMITRTGLAAALGSALPANQEDIYLALGARVNTLIEGGTSPEAAASQVANIILGTQSGETASGQAFSFLSTSQFNRHFRSLIYVPNEQRQLRVQKVDENGMQLNGAVFALYADKACTREVARGTTADIGDETGTLIFTPSPETDSSGNPRPGYARMVWAANENMEYWLKEVSAPAGYHINETVTPIIQGIYSIYADAGTSGNGISVMAGVGKLAQTMVQFTHGEIDVTLQDITVTAQTQDSGKFSLTGWQDLMLADTNMPRTMNLHYGLNAVVDYGLHDADGGKNYKPFFVTDHGFIRVRAEQNTEALKGNSPYRNEQVEEDFDDIAGVNTTNLFSLINYVVVSDSSDIESNTGSLVIGKQVQGESLTDTDYVHNFKFKVQLTDEAGTPLVGSYYFFGTDKVGYVQSGNVIPLHHDESITILGLPAGTRFTVTELGTSAVGPGRRKVGKFWVVPENGVVEGTVKKGKPANGMFTNQTEEPLNLVIEKMQAVNNGVPTKNKLIVAEDNTLTYYLTVKNTGTNDATGITITDTIPDYLTLIFGSISDGGTNIKGSLRWEIGELAAGAQKTVSFKVRVPQIDKTTEWRNTAAVRSCNTSELLSNSVISEQRVTPTKSPKTDDGAPPVALYIVLAAIAGILVTVVLVCQIRQRRR